MFVSLTPSNLLDLIQYEFVEVLGFYNFNHGKYVAGTPTRIGHLDSRQSRDQPRYVARLASFRCNDDVGSHALPGLFHHSIKGNAGIQGGPPGFPRGCCLKSSVKEH